MTLRVSNWELGIGICSPVQTGWSHLVIARSEATKQSRFREIAADFVLATFGIAAFGLWAFSQ